MDMTEYVDRHGLSVAAPLARLLEDEILLGVSADQFWSGYGEMLRELAPQNAELLEKRGELQRQID